MERVEKLLETNLPTGVCPTCLPAAKVVAFLNSYKVPRMVNGILQIHKDQNKKREWLLRHAFSSAGDCEMHMHCLINMHAGR